ncbi:hypothetical protein ACFWAP_00900 [Streptomyces goshikiensis]|uniref:hypothetical protein n=1 Tax=Streptomyces goshikiensis TaxID=1942 RepID=UPI003668EBA3
MNTKVHGEGRDALTPLAQACLERAYSIHASLRDAKKRARLMGKDVSRTKRVIEADARYWGALEMLAVVLEESGISMAGYGGAPTADLALPFLEKWARETGREMGR